MILERGTDLTLTGSVQVNREKSPVRIAQLQLQGCALLLLVLQVCACSCLSPYGWTIAAQAAQLLAILLSLVPVVLSSFFVRPTGEVEPPLCLYFWLFLFSSLCLQLYALLLLLQS